MSGCLVDTSWGSRVRRSTGQPRRTGCALARDTFGACIALLFAATVGCSSPQGGTDVGNGATISLDLRAYESVPQQSAMSLGLSDGTRIDELWMVVDRIRLRPGTSCSGDDSETDLQGPLIADLLSAGVLPAPPSFAAQPGSFCSLRVGFEKLQSAGPSGTPTELAGLSILMRGARSDGTPFVVKATFGDEFELQARNGSFTLPAGSTELFLAYDVRPWMTALDLGTLTGSPIEISDQVNSDRLQAFEAAVTASARLFRDQDGNGQLSTDEHVSGTELADGT